MDILPHVEYADNRVCCVHVILCDTLPCRYDELLEVVDTVSLIPRPRWHAHYRHGVVGRPTSVTANNAATGSSDCLRRFLAAHGVTVGNCEPVKV